MQSAIGQVLKAVYAAAVAGLGALGALLVNDTGFGDITAGQWVFVVLTTLLAFGGVYALPGPTRKAEGGGA